MILLTAHSLTPRGRFEVETCPLTLEERNSQIQFTMPVGEAELTTGDWIRDDTDPGAGIVYRIRTVETNYQTRTVSCTAEHIIKVLRDTVIFGEVTPSDMGGTETSVSALAAIKNAINRQSDWVLNEQGFGYGSVSAGYTFNGDSVYEAIETVCSTLEDCWWSYDVSVYPFVLTIAHKATTATCEMRGGRNISSIRRTVDRSRMYTRIYPIGKENLHITGNYLSKNTNLYGVICKVETDQSIESEDHLRMWAQGRLNRHCEPSVTTSINGLELSQETGEPLDHLTLGTVCRVPLPEFGTTLNETITKLQWRDKIKEAENVSVTLSNEMEDVASIIRQEQASGSGLTGRGGRAGAKKAGEDHAWFVDTDTHVSMVAEAIVGHTEEAVNWSRVAELTVDGQGIHGHVTQAEQDIIANQTDIEINERNIALTVKSRQIPNDRLHGYASRAAFPAEGTSGHYYYYETGSGTSVERHYFRWNGSEYIPANVITGLDGHLYGNYVNAGEIAVEINESGNTEAHIDAKKIILGKSQLTTGDLETWAYGAETGDGVFAQYMTVETLTAQSVITKKLDASFAITGQLSVDGQASFAQGVIVGDTDGLGYVEVDGPVYATDFIVNGDNDYAGTLNVVDAEVDSTTGQLKIWKVGDAANEPSITFSRATSLTPAWSGGATAGAEAFLTITGTPAQNPALNYEIEFGGHAKTLNLYVNHGTPEAYYNDNNVLVEKYLSVPTKIDEYVAPATAGGQPTFTTRYTANGVIDATIVWNQGETSGKTTGWNAARGVSLIPDAQAEGGSIQVKIPSTTYGTPIDRTFELHSETNNQVVLRYNTAQSGQPVYRTVAQITHNKYNTGFDAVSAPSISTPTALGNSASNPNQQRTTISVTSSTDAKTTDVSPANSRTASQDLVLGKSTFYYSATEQRDCVNLYKGSTSGDVIGRIDVNSVFVAGRNNVINAGGAYSQSGPCTNKALNQYVTTLTVTNATSTGKVSYDSSYVPSGGTNSIKAVKPVTSGGYDYLRIWQRVNSLTGSGASSQRTVETFAGSSQVEVATITDYGDGYTAGYNAAARSPAGWIDYFGASTAAGSASIANSKRKEDGTALTDGSTLAAGWTLGYYYQLANGTKYYVAKWKVPDTAAALIAAGGEQSVDSDGDYTLNKYVTTLHVNVGGEECNHYSRGRFYCSITTSQGVSTVTLTRTWNAYSYPSVFSNGDNITVYTT